MIKRFYSSKPSPFIYVFAAVLKAGYLGLVIIAALSAVVASYYYLRVIVAMYFIEPHSDTLNFNSGILAKLVLVLCAIAILMLGVLLERKLPACMVEARYLYDAAWKAALRQVLI